MKILITLFLVCTICISAQTTTIESITTATISKAIKVKKTYWINGNSKKRHNSKCRYYGKTKSGYYTDKPIGIACKICGG